MFAAICSLSVIPVRATPDDTSEIITQLLFGETMDVLQWKSNWAKITCHHDGYNGWIDRKHITEIPTHYKSSTFVFETSQPVIHESFHFPLLLGSSLPNYDGISLTINQDKYTFSGQVISPNELDITREFIEKISRKYLYAPYLWGGRSPFGIDCSGLTQIVYKLIGIKLKRDASMQIEHGKTVDFLHEAKAGDLAFFENKKGKIHHVGIILEEQKIIHASGHVRIDQLDQQGIYNLERKKYTHRLRVIKNIFDYPKLSIS